MATELLVDAFIASQQSVQFYDRTRQALKRVLLALPESDFSQVTKNLVIVALHEGVLGQAMHFPNPNDNFKVVQLTLPQEVPDEVLCYVIAHEFGHVMQGRNWRKEDGDEFEAQANEWATKWGFPRTSEIDQYINSHWKDSKC